MTEVSIHDRLSTARKDLLDISCRNRLISTPRGEGQSSRLEVADELSHEVFRRLVAEQKAMGFASAKQDSSPQPSSDESPDSFNYEVPPIENEDALASAERHVDDRLQTRLSSEALQKKLLKLYYDARTFESTLRLDLPASLLTWPLSTPIARDATSWALSAMAPVTTARGRHATATGCDNKFSRTVDG